MALCDNRIEILKSARIVADFAAANGIEINSGRARSCCMHLGAVLADSTLQAGLNYTSVVRPRITRILADYSYTDKIDSLRSIVVNQGTSSFLNWHHPTKIERFESLVWHIDAVGIKDVADLQCQLINEQFCSDLQQLNGIGPKTVDYMACLVGIQTIAVDRHVKNYANRIGLETTNYRFLKNVFCYAADFLDVPRRDFDAWIWRQESGQTTVQLSLDLR